MNAKVYVTLGEELASYHFGQTHPFGPQRHAAFETVFDRLGLRDKVVVRDPVLGERKDIELFHTADYVDLVIERSGTGAGLLDQGDTPAFEGVYEAASWVVGSTLDAVDQIMCGHCDHAFVPIAGLHHAARGSAAGFCVFNDCGIAIEKLRQDYKLSSVAYVDIDAHHGDGVFYAFESDGDVIFADLHEDGRFLYPGTGSADETGKGEGKGLKLNIPMPMYASDDQMKVEWARVEQLLIKTRPDFIILQCGADSLKGDPITTMSYSEKAHAHAARRLCEMAADLGHNRVLALGGGGYNLDNIGKAWNAVVQSLM